MLLKENISLKGLTTMSVGGLARYFFNVKNIEDLKFAVAFAKEKKVSFFVLGGGSNVLIPDDGFSGVVIKMEIPGIEFKKINNNETTVVVGAGVLWDKFVKETVEKNLYGIENLSLIPGSVGASPVQNIGAYGVEVKDVILFVDVLNTDTMTIQTITNKECLFGYRDSLFKTTGGRKLIIVSVVFRLLNNGILKTDYADVQEFFLNKKDKPTLKTLREAIASIRTNKLPDMKKVGTVGSFFKNPVVSEARLQWVLSLYPDIKYFKTENDMFKISAGYLIDKIGKWKGVCVNNVCVYEKQALVLVCLKGASTKEILFFANKIRKDIKQKTKIDLEFEINLI